eukprot:6880614-Pyramimonas_sp.AAC.1
MAAPAPPEPGASLAATPSTLANWTVSDTSLQVLEEHNGPALRRMGANIVPLDAFELFHHHELLASPSLIIMSCVHPPLESREYLDRLLKHYTESNPSVRERNSFYETM